MTGEGGLLFLPLLVRGSHISTIHGLTLKGWENPPPFENKFESSLCYGEGDQDHLTLAQSFSKGFCSLHSCYSLSHTEKAGVIST